MRESFVIHTEYIEDLPEENKAEFLFYVYNYGAKRIVPELTGFAKTIWVKIQRRIDADVEQYEETVKARSNAGKKHKGNQYSKLEQNGTNGTQFQSVEQNGTNGTVYVSDNDIVNDTDTHTYTESEEKEGARVYDFSQNDIKPLKITPADFKAVSKQVFETIRSHNSSHGNLHKMPISKDYGSFMQKEARQLCEVFRDYDAHEVLAALNNYLRVADIDTWKSSFSFTAFCKKINEYTPEYFSIDRFEKSENKRSALEYVQEFRDKMLSQNPIRINVAVFIYHRKEWLSQGRPEGEDYLRLQNQWVREDEENGVNYSAANANWEANT